MNAEIFDMAIAQYNFAMRRGDVDNPSDPAMRLAPLGIHYGLVHEALLKGDAGWALRFAGPLLRQGDASTQWYMGLMHHTGSGVKKNLAAAKSWYQKAAAQGFCLAEDGLSLISAAEQCAKIDAEALNSPWMRVVYEDLKKLRCFERERDVVFWEFQRGGDLGRGEMQILLGMSYERGLHVPQHWQTALEWYRRAAVQGLKSALEHYKRLSWDMDGESDAVVVDETEVVCELARLSALRGPEPANEVDAYRWYLAAAQKLDRYACWRLHEIYLLGQGVEKSFQKSAEWFDAAFVGRLNEPLFSYYDLASFDLQHTLSEHSVLLTLRSEMKAAMGRPEATGGRVQLRPIGPEDRVGV